MMIMIATAVILLIASGLCLRRFAPRTPSWRALDRSIITRGASKKKLEEFAAKGPIDYIVVGSGLGGLTTASLLARAGFRVLVLEQHDVAGGATHSFALQGHEWDVGLHYIGSRLDTWWSPVRALFAVVSGGALEWSKCHDHFDVCVNEATGQKIPMFSNVEKKLASVARHVAEASNGAYSEAELLAKLRRRADHTHNRGVLFSRQRRHKKREAPLRLLCFPNISRRKHVLESGESTYDTCRYRRECWIATLCLGWFFLFKLLPRRCSPRRLLGWLWERHAGRSAAEVMASLEMPHELAMAVTYLYGDYGESPDAVPFSVQALLETHYDGGAFFPRGGSSQIAKTVVATLDRSGTDSGCFVRARVDRILVEDGVAVGVECRGATLTCARGVVSNAGACNTYERLLEPRHAAKALAALPVDASGAPAPSARLVYLFVGLDRTDAELALPGCNYWCLTPGGASKWDHSAAMRALQTSERFGDAPLPAVFLSFGSAKDDSNTSNATLQILAPVRYEWFKKFEGSQLRHRGQEYERLKDSIREHLLEHYLYRHFPQTRGRVHVTEVASPLSTNFYLNTLRGETYGLAHNLQRFGLDAQTAALHTETDVKNLTMVGQDQFTVGIIAALASGYVTTGYLSKFALLKAIFSFLLY